MGTRALSGRPTFGLEVVHTRRARRINDLRALLTPNGTVPISRLLAVLGCSIAQFKRDLDFLRTVQKVPVVWDRENRGYRLAPRDQNMSTQERANG